MWCLHKTKAKISVFLIFSSLTVGKIRRIVSASNDDGVVEGNFYGAVAFFIFLKR